MTKYRFATGAGETVQGWEAVIPILRIDDGPKLTCIGTGFFIHTGGLLATAAHVVRDALDDDGNPIAGLMTLQYVHPNKMIRRDIIKVTVHLRADVAVAGVETLTIKSTEQPLRNKIMTLTTVVPQVGDYVATWAFPKSVSNFTEKTGSVSINSKLYEGRIREEHRGGRDSVLLPGPCYETDLGVENGASGGPVFNESGHAFAINSTGFEGTDLAFASHLQSIGGLRVENVMTGDGELHKYITISELIERGEIAVVGSA